WVTAAAGAAGRPGASTAEAATASTVARSRGRAEERPRIVGIIFIVGWDVAAGYRNASQGGGRRRSGPRPGPARGRRPPEALQTVSDASSGSLSAWIHPWDSSSF